MRSSAAIRRFSSRNLISSSCLNFSAAVCVCVITLVALRLRSRGLNPASLWLDDEWVGTVVSRMGFADFFRLRPPVPIGFVAVEKIVRQISADPEWPLQLFPFVSSLVQIPLMAALTYRVTKRPGIAAIAAALAAVCPMSAELSVRVKQYAVDGLIVTLLLFAGIPLLTHFNRRKACVFAAGAALAAIFSFPSVFISVPLLHLALLLQLRRLGFRSHHVPARIAIVVCFDIAIAVVWALLLRGQSSQAMIDYWASAYMPTDLPNALRFLQHNGWDAIRAAVPESLTLVLFLVPLGLLDLTLQPNRRGLAVVLVAVCFELVSVSALRMYPLGGGRTDSFAHPVVILCVASGLNLIVASALRWIPGSHTATTIDLVGTAAALALTLGFGSPAGYPPSGDSSVVHAADRVVQPSDGLIVYPHGAISVGYYGRWPLELVAWPAYAHNFHSLIQRPKTLVLSPYAGYWDNPAGLERELTAFLAKPYPRLVYIVAGWVHAKPNALIQKRITKSGYKVEQDTHRVVSQMLVFTRTR